MPYLNETGLAYYNEKIQPWIASQTVKTIPSSIYPWTLSDKAGAVTCWPVGGTELLPTVDFMFSEVPPASGDKGPENPSTISGVESVTVGNVLNLFRLPSGYSVTRSGVTCTVDNDGVITLNGICTAQDSFISYKNNLPLGKAVFPSGTTLYMKMVELGGSCTLNGTLGVKMQMSCSRTNGTSWYPGVAPTLSEASDSSSVSFKIVSSVVVIYSGAVYNNYRIKAQFNINELVQAVEDQIENIYTLPLGSTFYGGTVDLATGVMTVTWVGFSLTGTESKLYLYGNAGVDTRLAYNLIQAGFPYPRGGANDSVCSHSSSFDANNAAIFGNYYVRANGYFVMQDKNNVIGTTLDSYRAWLASQHANGTPVAVTYKIATPYTVQLTPTQILSLTQADKYTPRLNTIYTDASAVQVGYVKSPIREEFELTQAIVGLGGNI